MSILQLLIINIIANLDNIPVSIVSKKINKKNSFTFSLLSSIILLIIVFLKHHIVTTRTIYIVNNISSLLIIIIGVNGLFNINKVEHNSSNLFSIAISLSLNNVAIYLSLKDHAYSYLYTIFNFIFSYMFFIVGIIIKEKINCKIINILSSTLLCIIGIINLIINI